MRQRVDVAVVGGGIAGLTAAYTLCRAGARVALLEAGTRWGGVVLTERVDGFVLDAGPDSVLAQKPEALALAREIGLGDRLVPISPARRAFYVLRRGELHPVPEGMLLAVPTRLLPMARSRLFSWRGKLRMGLEPFVKAPAVDADESLASFLGRRLGREAVERMGEPFLAGIHSGDPEQLSVRSTFPRLVELERRHGSLIRALMTLRGGPHGPAFFSLAGGLGELVDGLVAQLPAGVGRLRSKVDALVACEDGYAVRAGAEDIRARAVVLALPPRAAAHLVEPLDAVAGGLLSEVRSASTATVMLGYRREDVAHPLDGHGLVVPRTEALHTTACSFSSEKFPGRAPAGHVLLRGFVGGVRNPRLVNFTDQALVATVHAEMSRVLGLRALPVMSRVYRWPSATPQLEVGHGERMALLEERMATLPGLFLTGAGLRGTGVPDGIADARTVAARAFDHAAAQAAARAGEALAEPLPA